MNIGFVTDTNILKKENLEKGSKFLDYIIFFTDYIESLEKTPCKDKLIYFMPNIIIEELYNQKLKVFQGKYNSLCKDFQNISYGLNENIPTCKVEDVLKKEINEVEEKVKILQLHYTEEMFREITEDALKKNPPFDKSDQGKKTDSGYKDSLIWKTFIHSKEIDECEKIYFFSGDKAFKNNQEYLLNEFKTIHPNTNLEIVFFETNGQQRKNCLQKIINDNNLIETEIIKLYNLDLILEHIRSIKYNYDEEVYYYKDDEKIILDSIDFNEFSEDDFEINNVKNCNLSGGVDKKVKLTTKKDEELNKKYEVLVSFTTNKYEIKNYESDNNYKRMINGEIKFIFEKTKDNFNLCSNELVEIEFNSTIIENISKFSKEFVKIYNEKVRDVVNQFAVNFADSLKQTDLNQKIKETINTLDDTILNNNLNFPTIDELNDKND